MILLAGCGSAQNTAAPEANGSGRETAAIQATADTADEKEEPGTVTGETAEASAKEEAAESAEAKRYTDHGENILADHPTIEELYQTEPYKDFLPSYIPDELVYKWALRFIPGEYLQDNGAYYKQTEKTYMYFSTVEGRNSENSLNVYMYHKASVTRPSADEISVSDIDQSGRYYLGVDKVKGTVYSLTFNADGWEICYQYKHLCTEEELLTPEELFDIATSSQYFKDHPLSVD